jgi:arginine decarboxylase
MLRGRRPGRRWADPTARPRPQDEGRSAAPTEPNPKVIDELLYIDGNMTVKNFRELYHDAVEQRDELFSLFNIGLISLEQRAFG